MEIKNGFQISWILVLVLPVVSSQEARRFSLLNPLKNALSEVKKEVETHWKSYAHFKDEYNKLIILGITDPTQLLKKLNMSITLPTPTASASEINQTAPENKPSSSEEGSEAAESYEIISPQHRQGLPAPAPKLPGFEPPGWAISIFGAVITLPFLIANLVMAIIIFGINVSNRVDSPTLSALRQDQVNALATYGGVPLAIVAPPDEDGDDPAADLGRLDADEQESKSGEDSGEGFKVIKPGRCKFIGKRSISGDSLRTDTLEGTFNSIRSEFSTEQVGTLVGFVIFLIIGGWIIEYFGLDTALTLGLGTIALVLLSSHPKRVSDYFGKNLFQKRKSSTFSNLCEDMEELSGEVNRAIEKEYK